MRYCSVCQKQLQKQKTYCSRPCLRIGYTGRRHSEDALKKMRGRKLSSETIARQNLKKVREHVRIEGSFSCHRCSKHFNSNTSLRSHMSYCTDDKIQQPASCSDCGQTFKSSRSMLIHKNLKHAAPDLIEARREKMVEAKKNCEVRKTSRAEERFFEEISLVKPDAIRNFMIDGSSHVYDVYIPSMNTIVEFDGDFWHGNKRLYELSDRMKKQFRLDQSNSAKAIAAGYRIVRVWESEASRYIETLRKS